MTKKFPASDDIDRWFHYGVDVTNRTIYMGSLDSEDEKETGTDFAMAEYVIKGLHTIGISSSKKPVIVILNNPGGDEYHGWAIYGYMKRLAKKVPVIVEVYGQAMSMGSIILQAATTRRMDKHAKLMIHYGSWGYNGHAMDFLKSAEECKKQCEKMEDLFLEKMKKVNQTYNRSKLRRLISFDRYLDPEECLELGLIDEIC